LCVCVCCLCRPTFGFHRRSEWEMSRLDGNDGSPFFCFFLTFNTQETTKPP
jgi:hypothetical protein